MEVAGRYRDRGRSSYPPGNEDKKHLRTLILIHGGPADADCDGFGADCCDWAMLAAAYVGLVFQSNYRGSSGYGDDFMPNIGPHLVSAPGRDILSGVDSLVTRGIADPAHLSIGGYSYGGYMTNWLITQTKRFEAEVTGAGAVEHAANWETMISPGMMLGISQELSGRSRSSIKVKLTSFKWAKSLRPLTSWAVTKMIACATSNRSCWNALYSVWEFRMNSSCSWEKTIHWTKILGTAT
jgi:pimeloyl-ACP methyl ester carboxylesterase